MGLRLQAGEIAYLGGRGPGQAARGREACPAGASGAPQGGHPLPGKRGVPGVVRCVQKSCPAGAGSARLLHSQRGLRMTSQTGGSIPNRASRSSAALSRAAPPDPPNPRAFHRAPSRPVPHRCRCPPGAPGTHQGLLILQCPLRLALGGHGAAAAAAPLRAVPVPVPLPVPAAAAAPPGPRGAGPGHCPGEGSAALRLRRQRPAPAAPVTGNGGAGLPVPGRVRRRPAGSSVLWRDPIHGGLCQDGTPGQPVGAGEG